MSGRIMAAARTITISDFIDQINYDLRNTKSVEFTDAEMLIHINRMFEMIYYILFDMNSELILSSGSTVSTVAGTETYALSSDFAANISDLWAPYRLEGDNYREGHCAVYITDSSSVIYEPLEMVEYAERYSYLIAGSTSRTRPVSFYIDGDNIGLLPVPDAVYTLTIDKYFPNFTPASAASENMPYKNIFNQAIGNGVKLLAKNRNDDSIAVETELMKIFTDAAKRIVKYRRHRPVQLRRRIDV
jgi:hypothetical protein